MNSGKNCYFGLEIQRIVELEIKHKKLQTKIKKCKKEDIIFLKHSPRK